jgi:adenylate cyclase
VITFWNPTRSPELSDDLWGSETVLAVSTRRISVLVADIRDFTGLSLEVGEARVAELMSAFNRASGAILDRAGAWTQKYLGDAVMAVWTNPSKSMLDLVHAALSAIPAMNCTAAALQQQFGLSRQVSFGFGINAGVASIGNLGSMAAADHTALGDVVNKAFRLEASTRNLPSDIAFGEEVRAILSESIDLAGLVTKHRALLKGYTSEMDIYSLDVPQVDTIIDALNRRSAKTEPS